MKLAEALARRKDLTDRLFILSERISSNTVTKEGETPAEDVKILIEEALRLSDENSELISKINRTNANTIFDGELTLTDALVKRDAFISKRNVLLGAVEAATSGRDRYSQTELKDIRHIDVKELQKKIDEFSLSYRELDLKIQEKNWQTELL